MTRDFAATPEQLYRAHTDQELFVRWNGPDGMETTIQVWDARTGGSWRYTPDAARTATPSTAASTRSAPTGSCRRSPSTAYPDGVALETITFEDLGDGRTRLHALSLCDSFEGRDMMLASGMEVGVHEGYAKLDGLLADGSV